MNKKTTIRLSARLLWGTIALVAGLGLIGCSTALDAKATSAPGLSVEIGGISGGSAAKALNDDLTIHSVKVYAYKVVSAHSFIPAGESSELLWNGTSYAGHITIDPLQYGAIRFLALVKSDTTNGNVLYSGESTADQTITADTTSLAVHITVASRTKQTAVNLNPSGSPYSLASAGAFAILAETGISTSGTTHITGDIGISSYDITSVTGFTGPTAATGHATAPEVSGFIYAAGMASPTPGYLTTAVTNMTNAYGTAKGIPTPDVLNLGAGDISGLTLVPGLYKWTTGVDVNSDVTLNGGPSDVWIFQISGNLTVANGMKVILAGGADPKNIFWQVAGGTGVALGTTADFNGIVLAIAAITVNTGATIHGRLLAQAAVTLLSNKIYAPDSDWPTTAVATSGNAQNTVSWSPVTGATSYNVYRSTTDDATPLLGSTKITGVTSSPYIDTGLVNGTPYYYVVTAVTNGVESLASNRANATPVAP